MKQYAKFKPAEMYGNQLKCFQIKLATKFASFFFTHTYKKMIEFLQKRDVNSKCCWRNYYNYCVSELILMVTIQQKKKWSGCYEYYFKFVSQKLFLKLDLCYINKAIENIWIFHWKKCRF